MTLVIADTGPVNYLILIDLIDLLPRMFEQIALPLAVQIELADPSAPSKVRNWVATPPEWLKIHKTAHLPQVSGLDDGETAAIALAEYLRPDLLLIDERAAYRVARKKSLPVIGTLGLLDLVAEQGLIDFAHAIAKLERTTFRRPEALLETLLKKHERKR